MRRRLALAVVLLASPAASAEAASLDVRSGPARAVVTDAPFSVSFTQRGGVELRTAEGVGFRDGGGERRVTGARSLRREGGAVVADLDTAGGGTLRLRVRGDGDGVIVVELLAPGGTRAVRAEFAAPAGERFYGFGERSDFVERRGHEALNYVADGPYREEDRPFVKASVPPWADLERDDATYYPLPWLLSSRGYGVLVDEDATSRLRPAVDRPDRWSAEADGARLRLRLFAGPTPAAALRRFTAAHGRQPPPQAPWTFGPWFQTGQPNVVPVEEERAMTKAQRDAGAPVSVAETQMHYLPCGAHRGREAAERERTDSFHADGLARLVYFNPLLCVSYRSVYDRAAAAGVLQRGPGGVPFSYPAFVGGSGPAGFTQEPLAQFDFTHPRTEAFYAQLVDEAVREGNDGWMEDFGESTPPAITQHDGSTGEAAHNRYPTDYHCALKRIAERYDRPLVRFLRSGWIGTARCAEVVWGGDPTTVWGFDGLSSAVTQVLSIGLSGVARWGTDIGGYNSFGADREDFKPGATENEKLTPEMLIRWIELGALLPVMRTKRSGIAIPSYDRPQVFDPEILPFWRAMTELHLQLNPYLRAADDEHRRTGLPIARHLVLAWPGLARAQTAHDQYLLGRDLLAAPVVEQGKRARPVWLPPGRWVAWWSGTRFERRSGAYRLGRATALRGGRQVSQSAPLGRPPLFVRAGAVLPLLEADVDTLAPYGREKGLVRFADRRDHLRLLAFPRGRSVSPLPDGGAARSLEGRGRWTLVARTRRRTRWTLEASLRTLARPFAPRAVLVDGRPARPSRWRYDARRGVLHVVAKGARVRIDVLG